ncbi:MAG: hypothetical protein LBR14_04365 [Clostridiales Family XIII bacterium]|jgi:hypothetical protein|nr:hypothetical protein [Clostridiales Family XIII bacterium]
MTRDDYGRENIERLLAEEEFGGADSVLGQALRGAAERRVSETQIEGFQSRWQSIIRTLKMPAAYWLPARIAVIVVLILAVVAAFCVTLLPKYLDGTQIIDTPLVSKERTIAFTGGEGEDSYINPQGFYIPDAEAGDSTPVWTIKSGNGASELYEGDAKAVTLEIQRLQKEGAEGSYLLTCTFTTADGYTAYLERSFEIRSAE